MIEFFEQFKKDPKDYVPSVENLRQRWHEAFIVTPIIMAFVTFIALFINLVPVSIHPGYVVIIAVIVIPFVLYTMDKLKTSQHVFQGKVVVQWPRVLRIHKFPRGVEQATEWGTGWEDAETLSVENIFGLIKIIKINTDYDRLKTLIDSKYMLNMPKAIFEAFKKSIERLAKVNLNGINLYYTLWDHESYHRPAGVRTEHPIGYKELFIYSHDDLEKNINLHPGSAISGGWEYDIPAIGNLTIEFRGMIKDTVFPLFRALEAGDIDQKPTPDAEERLVMSAVSTIVNKSEIEVRTLQAKVDKIDIARNEELSVNEANEFADQADFMASHSKEAIDDFNTANKAEIEMKKKKERNNTGTIVGILLAIVVIVALIVFGK